MVISVLLKAIDSLSEWSGKLASWLILPLAFGMTYEVILRYAFDKPTIWAFEMTWILYGAYVVMGAAYCHWLRGHVRLDMFYNLLSLRGRAILEVVTYLLVFFPLWVMLTLYSIDYAITSWILKETSYATVWRPPVYPSKIVMALGFGLLLIQGVSDFIKNLSIAFTGKRP